MQDMPPIPPRAEAIDRNGSFAEIDKSEDFSRP